MRIVHILTRLLRGGSEENTLATCRWQIAQGHDVTLLHGTDSEAEAVAQDAPVAGLRLRAVPDLVHPVDPVRDMRALGAMRDLLRTLRPDLVHTHQSKAGILGRLAAGAVPSAACVHGIHIVPFDAVGAGKRQLYKMAERMVSGRTDLFIAVSPGTGARYVEAGIAPANKVVCVRSGMELARFRNPQPPADWRDLLRVPDGPKPPVAVMLAAFEPRKRHIPFLEALARQAMPRDLRIVLAGDGPMRAAVADTVRRLGLGDRVVMPGHRSDPEALLALADLSVLTSTREGLPRVAVQSLAAGCPPVLSRLPGIGELVASGRNGLILPSDDLDLLAAQMIRALGAPTTLARWRAGARASDVSAWSLDALGRETTAHYERLIRRDAA